MQAGPHTRRISNSRQHREKGCPTSCCPLLAAKDGQSPEPLSRSSKRKYAHNEDYAKEAACREIKAILSEISQTPPFKIVHCNRNQGCAVSAGYENGRPWVVPRSKPPSGPCHGLPGGPLNCHGKKRRRGEIAPRDMESRMDSSGYRQSDGSEKQQPQQR